jgi:hypothetical protein
MEIDMTSIHIATRTDAHNSVLNSGHRDRFDTDADFKAAVEAVWRAARDNQISVEQFDAICSQIVEG